MIEYLQGKVLLRLPHSVVVDVNGVGYGVEMPLSALCEVPPPGQGLSLFIDTYVREDAIRLFGFLTFEDRQAFQLLRSVSGIGPKTALAVLSTMDAKSLRQAVLQNRATSFESVPGIGKRTAEKLMLELRPKVERFGLSHVESSSQGSSWVKRPVGAELSDYDGLEEQDLALSIVTDIRSALENLGYKEKEIAPAIGHISQVHAATKTDFQIMLREALKVIRNG